ncbi:unnamed protein product [Arctogadus glacialis]
MHVRVCVCVAQVGGEGWEGGWKTAGSVCPVQSELPPPTTSSSSSSSSSTAVATAAEQAALSSGSRRTIQRLGASGETQPSSSPLSLSAPAASARYRTAQTATPPPRPNPPTSHLEEQGRGDPLAHAAQRCISHTHIRTHTHTHPHTHAHRFMQTAKRPAAPLSHTHTHPCVLGTAQLRHLCVFSRLQLIHSLARSPRSLLRCHCCQSLCLTALCPPAREWSSWCLGVCCRGLSEHTHTHTQTHTHTHTHTQVRKYVRTYAHTYALRQSIDKRKHTFKVKSDVRGKGSICTLLPLSPSLSRSISIPPFHSRFLSITLFPEFFAIVSSRTFPLCVLQSLLSEVCGYVLEAMGRGVCLL